MTWRERIASGPRQRGLEVWFTVADGVLSDTFSPTIENSNVNTLQYIVTDGRSFTDMQQRDMTYTVSSPDRSGMVCQVTSRDPKRGFALVTDYLTDPARDSVVMHTTLEPLDGTATAALRRLKVYVRYDAQIDNTGGGGTANSLPNNAVIAPASRALVSSDTVTPTGPWAAEVVGALTADRRFERASSGFVGTPSDGLRQLDTYHRLRNVYNSATDGNVVQTAQINDPTRPFTLALGFAPRHWSYRHSGTQRDQAVRRDAQGLRRWLARLRREAAQPSASGGPLLLAGGQRDQGRRGQDQFGRVRGGAGRSVGTVDAGDHHARRLHVPLRVRSRQLRHASRRPARRWRPGQRPTDGRVPVRPRTAARREFPA